MSTPLTPDAARALLGSRGWLSAVPADFRDAFLGACRPRSIAAGELFSLAGDDAAAGLGIYGVVSGQVAVTSAMNSAASAAFCSSPAPVPRASFCTPGVAAIFSSPDR